jgi:GTP-binding protein
VVDEVYELFLDLDADESQIEFPIVYTNARDGKAALDPDDVPAASDLKALLDVLLTTVPAPSYEPGHPLQAHVTNLDADAYVGRLALCRVRNGTIRKGQDVAWCRADGTTQRVRVAELYVTEALDRVDAAEAGPGELIAVAGIPQITIGETLADLADPRPLPVIPVDEPSLSVTIGINTSPLGRDATGKLPPPVRDRLDAELVGNVTLRVIDTERPDAGRCRAAGELQLAVLVELMRREGFELTVGQPQVLTREIDGKLHEPVEAHGDRRARGLRRGDHATTCAAQGAHGADGQPRHGLGADGVPRAGAGADRLPHRVPHETRGTGLLHQVFDGYDRWAGEIRTRPSGSLVADRRGKTASFALFNLQERGTLFVSPGEEVYEGMVVGENARSDDLDVNAVKEKQLNNIRSSTSEVLVRLTPARKLSLDQAMEFAREDECVEVTPDHVRLRKLVLDAIGRQKAARNRRNAAAVTA